MKKTKESDKSMVKTVQKDSQKAVQEGSASDESDASKDGREKREERELVIPGQVVAKGMESLPGDGTLREGDEIIAIKFGLLDSYGKLLRVIPLAGIYMPRKEDIIIGKVIDVTLSSWIIDINSTVIGLLGLAEGTREYVSRGADLSKYYAVGDLVAAKVTNVRSKNVELTMKGPGLRKLDDGLFVSINPNKVPRVIGRMGSMIKLIKEETGCNISVGQNGLVWVRGNKTEDELMAKAAIEHVERYSHIPDLTDKMKDFLGKLKKGGK